MTPLWTSSDAATATGGRTSRDWAATGVSIDTRTLKQGDLFVALAAARDGHDFVAQALEKGAAAALVTHIPEGVSPEAPLLIVADVLKGLEALGRAARTRTKARVIGVTGSVGKTSTKEMLRAMLSGQGVTHAAEASYNNHWGVPLTLARMPVDSDFAVIEIGMSNPGEIAPLARLARPHVALITTVAPAHMAAFGSIEGIAREKGAIFEGLEPGGTAVINLDLDTTPVLTALAEAAGAQILGFGRARDAAWHLDEVRPGDEITVVRASHDGQMSLFRIASPGAHFAMNALGALASVAALGADPVLAAHDLGRWQPPSGRGTRERIELDVVEETFFDLIDDSFNANPASLAASLDMLIRAKPVDGIGALGAGRRIAVLGDMLELGPQELQLHAAVADHPGLKAVTLIHCVGPRMRELHRALPLAQRGEWVETAAELAGRARALMDPGDILLVKGSKGSKVSLVAEALRRLGTARMKTEGTE
ncbi:UDP-N-acetylmuramoyl-tripeptide--D-alanyl-D-alanine ligase [Pseudomonas sp. GX19020]|uniref:UDP-N-acetylmuramoyl-tripeptide--D-alanyl-D- alanine ligase n=1 Tax=Pseudomonas sp. GX19020 TaxID=2942277 RepID=UPI00201A01C2|nr:UDP-N-acetylmuramoyl-tripeptide--D-alanyl-D-alanine ligase [Pseudomonas sp. GX19020]MCL4066979.1 UDP-N-acetylmuramoyl-tripeptide--D-alanyl-D-alanine ligase [Pseudomonas sp. GX19020]